MDPAQEQSKPWDQGINPEPSPEPASEVVPAAEVVTEQLGSSPPVSEIAATPQPFQPSQPVSKPRSRIWPLVLAAVLFIMVVSGGYGAIKFGLVPTPSWWPWSTPIISPPVVEDRAPVATESASVRPLSLESMCEEDSQYSDLTEATKNSDKVCSLGLRGQNLTEFPQEILSFTNLKELFLSENKLTEIPKEIGGLKELRILRLQSNMLETLPEEIKELSKLQELWLSGNNFSQLEKEKLWRVLPETIIIF